MRLTIEQSKQNRQTILTTASRLFRLRGLDEVSVADIMKECGFTHGGFYNHFSSKEDLAVESVTSAFERSTEVLSKKIESGSDPQDGLNVLISDYLDPSYRDTPSGGCPAAALPADAARSSKKFQSAFSKGLESYLESFVQGMEGDEGEAREKSIALLSGLVGALVLSRAVKKSSPELSAELLRSARSQLCKQNARSEVAQGTKSTRR